MTLLSNNQMSSKQCGFLHHSKNIRAVTVFVKTMGKHDAGFTLMRHTTTKIPTVIKINTMLYTPENYCFFKLQMCPDRQ